MIVQDLAKVNPLYQFSLSWFKDVFVNAMALTNPLKGGESEVDTGKGDKGKSENTAMTVDDRIQLLTTTLT
jgi:hypothetical protein